MQRNQRSPEFIEQALSKARARGTRTLATVAYVLGLGSMRAARSERRGHPDKPTQIRANPRDWFERLTGFQETSYDATRNQLEVVGQQLRSRATGQSYGIGRLELPALAELRHRAESGRPVPGRRQVSIVQGEARQLHGQPEYAGSLIQVASQFNLLEMVSENVSPEQGVTRYVNDRTQGPACAIAAGAATIYRNYFAPVGEAAGQTSTHQLDGFASLGEALAQAVGRPAESLWSMRNGYSMFKPGAVGTISQCLHTLDSKAIDELRCKLRIGLHWDVEVTDGDALPRPQVSQAFCSALPVSYNHRAGASADDWKPFASLVLEAAYEGTLWAAVANAQRHGSKTVLLTMLGGGAFGNDEAWIHAAMRRAIETVANHGLNIVFVSYGAPSAGLLELAKAFA